MNGRIFKGCGVIILNNENKILLGQRAKSKVGEPKGLWCIPGGKIEENEALALGAIRELKEETNLDLEEDNIKFIAKTVQGQLNVIKLDYTFAAKKWSGNIIVKEDEMLNYKFFSIDEIMSMYKEIYPATLVSIANYINSDFHKDLKGEYK